MAHNPSSSSRSAANRAAIPSQLVVGMGDMLVSNDVSAQLVTYALVSCVGVAIYDPVAKVGG